MKKNQKKKAAYNSLAYFLILFFFCSPAPRYTKKTALFDTYKVSPQIKKTESTESKKDTIPPKTVEEIDAAQINESEEQFNDETTVKQQEELPPEFTEEGLATYYSDKLQGRKTAYGERYNKHLFTAAHKTLPLNTMVKVTSLTNDKSVVVRINDRGPFTKNRIIDLSKAAAREIGLISAGIMKVRIETVNESRTE